MISWVSRLSRSMRELSYFAWEDSCPVEPRVRESSLSCHVLSHMSEWTWEQSLLEFLHKKYVVKFLLLTFVNVCSGVDQGLSDCVCGRGGLLQSEQCNCQRGQCGECSSQHQVIINLWHGISSIIFVKNPIEVVIVQCNMHSTFFVVQNNFYAWTICASLSCKSLLIPSLVVLVVSQLLTALFKLNLFHIQVITACHKFSHSFFILISFINFTIRSKKP